MKMASMTAAVADALVHRGVSRRTAAFASQAATTVFMTAVDEWAREPQRGLAASIQDALSGLRAALGSQDQDTSPLGSPSA
jgi:hypothetical protein